jgi:hypothetical protein
MIKENHSYYDCEYWSTNVSNSNWILFLTNSVYFSMIMKFWCSFMWTTSFSHSQHREKKTQRIQFVDWTIQNCTHNVHKLITSSFRSSTADQEMIVDINAFDRFEKTKRSVVISNSTIFIENKAKFEHWLSTVQSKLKTNENWYLIERMIMTYVNIKLNDETYKHIAARLNKNSFHRYLTINEIFDDFKRIYVDFNKMQKIMNVFIRLTQMSKYTELHVFWNKFQRLMKKMNLSEHFLLVELKRKMFYKLQNVMSFKFNIIDDIYELARLTQLKEDHYKRINDVKSRKRSSAITTAEIEIETRTTTSKTISIITISSSINEKAEQTSTRTTIWNSNQFRTLTSRITRTSNLDSTKEELIKAKKCFNCNESKHLNKDCSKLRKFRIVEINVRNDTKKSRKE